MNVAIYFSPLGAIGRPTGVGVHILRMAEQLAAWSGVSASLLANRQAYDAARATLPPAMAAMPVTFLAGPEGLRRRLAFSSRWFSVDRRGSALDWVYCPKEQPVATRSARLAVTVHDVLPFERGVSGLGRRFQWMHQVRWQSTMRRILARANLIATVSEFSRRRMLDLFRISDERRLVVVGNGVSPAFFRYVSAGDATTLDRYGVAGRPYVVLVGGLNERKGADVVLRVAERLRRQHSDLLVLVTGRRHDQEYVSEVEAAGRCGQPLPILLPGYVPETDLAVLLSNSQSLLFPSRYEGFGIPVVEAMAAGAPVICSRAGALPEVAGEAAVYVSGTSEDEILDAIAQVGSAGSLRESLILAGKSRARQFTWSECASRLTSAMQAG